jgi:hypothetical protein
LFHSASRVFLGGVCVLSLSACISPPPPYQEYTIARTAVRAAQDVDSARFASGLWAKAEESFRNGEKAYREVDFDIAKDLFKKATYFAERAEDATRLKKFESGDSFP